MSDELIMDAVMWAEVDPDVYAGDKGNDIRNRWRVAADGDMDEDIMFGPLELNANTFPPGTTVTVKIPLCPDCTENAEMCSCGFDWKEWTLNKYS